MRRAICFGRVSKWLRVAVFALIGCPGVADLAGCRGGTARALVTCVAHNATVKEMHMSKHLGKAEQALYERLRMGPLNAGEASFFSRQIGALVAAKIARRTPEGGAELVNPASYVTQPPPASPSSAPPAPSQSGTMHAVALPTITARVPQEVIDYLDSLGLESRGAAVRKVFADVLATAHPGVRKVGGR